MSDESYKSFGKLDNDVVKAFKGASGKIVVATNRLRKDAGNVAKDIDTLTTEVGDILRHAGQVQEKHKKEDLILAAKCHSKLVAEIKKMGSFSKFIGGVITRDLKVESPNLYRALKVLATGLDSIAATALYRAKSHEQQIKNFIKERSKEETVERTQELALVQVEKALRKARACLQKVKSDPTIETWKKVCNLGMGRDVKMAMVSLVGAQKKSQFPEFDPGRTKDHYNNSLPWDTGKTKSTLPEDADQRVILVRAKEYSHIIKNIAEEYEIRI